MAEQELLLVIESGLEKGPPLAPEPPKIAPPARLKEIDRTQSYWGAVAIEESWKFQEGEASTSMEKTSPS